MASAASDVALYERRFSPADRRAKAAVWRVLCEDFFQRYVGPEDTVLDVGAGLCEFINHIRCGRKLALDLQEEVRRFAAPDVQVHCGPSDDLGWIAPESVDVVFASNVFEHLPSKDAVLATLTGVRRILRPRGRFLILQPNIRYAFREYWDFFDHHLPFSHVSMQEALAVAGFNVTELRPRFLPYSTVGALPRWPILVRLYLRVPLAHLVMGKQMFLVAVKSEA
jgi:SAM-dependent methyltransferase